MYAVRKIRSQREAKRFLKDFMYRPAAMLRLRALLGHLGLFHPPGKPKLDLKKLTALEMFDQLARHIAEARVLVADQIDRTNAPSVFDDKKDAPPPGPGPGPAPGKKKLTWIEVKVVEDGSDKPITPVRLTIKTPDGNESFYTTNSDGLIRIDDIDEGTCDVRCEPKGAEIPTTMNFVTMGDKPSGKNEAGPVPAKTSTLRVLEVEDRKVKTGDTLDSLAAGAKITKNDLTTFNFQTNDPAQVNEQVGLVVGSTKTDAGGMYQLDSADKPGILRLPKKFEQTGLATGKRHVIRTVAVPDVKRVWIIEMEHLHFHFDSAVLLADYLSDDPNAETARGEHVTAISVLAQALAETRLHPGRKLLITGHTDTSGSAAYNLPLSQQRADSVLAALVGDRDGWVKVALAKHKVEDYQLILKWVSLDRNWPCDPGKIDNKDGPGTQAAVKAFQQRYNDDFGQSIGVDGIVGKETWGAFFDVYMKELAEVSDTDEAGLAGMRGSLQYVDGSKKAVGCGENFPKDHRGVDNWRSRENRRVEICFFSPNQLPVMECHPGGGKCNAAVCQVNDPKVFIPTIIPVPAHQPKVGPLIVIDDLPAPSGGTTTATPAPAPAPAPSPAPASPAPAPAPAAAPAAPQEVVVLVKKAWNTVARRPVTLKTDAPYDGNGTLTITGTTINYFDAITAGNEITSAANNVFTGDKLKDGVQIFAEGVSASASMKDVKLTLALSGGALKVKPPADAKLTAIEAIVDICGERTAAGTDPVALAQPPAAAPAAGTASNDKLYGGRFIQLQDADKNCGRAQLIVRKVTTTGFAGTLVLRSLDASGSPAKVQIFAAEDPATAGAAIALPHEMPVGDFAGGDVKFWVQGAGASAALRDTGFALDVKTVGTDADKVTVTVVEFTKIKATIKSTPANTPRAGHPAPADHTFESTKLMEDFADDKNKPLVLMRNAQPDIQLEVTTNPAAPVELPIVWKAIRNPNDDATLGGKADLPTLTPDAADKRKAKFAADNKGSFRIRPFIDTNGNTEYNAKEPSMPLNLVLADVTLVSDNSAGLAANLTSTLSATDFSVRNGTWPNTWAACLTAGGAGMTMELVADVTGGGADGRLGLDKVFGGLVNMLRGNEITLTYQTPTAPVTSHVVRNRYVLNRPAATGDYGGTPMFQPGHTAPDLLLFPVLDTGRSPGGLGAETACMGRSGVWDPAPADRPKGKRYTLRCIDSPGRSFVLTHPDHPTERLVTIHYVQQFQANFCFWTNVTNVRTQSGDAADRVYGALRTMNWAAVGDWTIAWTPKAHGPGFDGALANINPHNIEVTGPATISPIGRAQDHGIEVRPPSGITSAIAWETT